jgi:hypothetical protein
MTDTPPDVAAAFRALIMQRTEGERAMMAFEMFDLARLLMTADIRAQQPGITDDELRVRVFERTYGHDFDESDRRRVMSQISAARANT